MADGFVEKILAGIDNLVTLQITTVVDVAGAKKKIETSIDLLQGDIRTEMSEEFVTGDYVTLREFHQKREEQGQQIVQDNVDALVKLIELFKKARSEQGQQPAISAGA